MRVMPKVGPFKALAFRPPDSTTERMFQESFNRTLDLYRTLIPQAATGRLQIRDVNLDTGEPVVPGQYKLADRAYAKLVRKLASRDFAGVPEDMRRNLLQFYGGASPIVAADEKPKERIEIQAALAKLKSLR